MLELLEEPAYRHVLANHLPVTGLAVAWVFLVVALVQRHRSTMLVALGLVALMAGSALPVATAGDDAYPFVYDALDGTGRAWLDHHLYLADRWVPILYANAVLALAAICIGVWRAQLLRRLAIGTALATAGGLAAAGSHTQNSG